MNHQIFDISCDANQWKGSDAEALIKSWDLDVDKVSYIKRIVRCRHQGTHLGNLVSKNIWNFPSKEQ